MSGILNHLKAYESLYRIISGIDKNLFKVYNIPYCTHQSNEVFFVVMSDDVHIPTEIREAWSVAQGHCLDNGVTLNLIIMKVEDYKNWVNDSKLESHYIKDVECCATPKLLESGYLSIDRK